MIGLPRARRRRAGASLRALIERPRAAGAPGRARVAGRRPGARRARGRRRDGRARACNGSCRRPATATTTRYEHTQRVGDLAARLARGLGLSEREVALIRRAAPLHDIGKIAIPDSILLKPGRLTEEEFEVVKTHAVLGARVLAGGGLGRCCARPRRSPATTTSAGTAAAIRSGLAGDAIPVAARIVHLADVFDVLVHERPYRESFTAAAAAEEIARGAGTDFDPEVVAVFSRIGPE